MEYKPPLKRGKIAIGIGLAVSAVLLAGGAALFSAPVMGLGLPLGLAMIGLSLLVFFIYKAYQHGSMRYALSRNGLEISCGVHRVFIPNRELNWARPLADFGSTLPLPKPHLPGLVLGEKEVNGLGRVEYCLSEPSYTVLVKGPTRVYAISPQNPAAFSSQADLFQQMGPQQTLPALDRNARMLWKEIWAEKQARISILCGLGLSLLLLVLSIAINAFYPSITWVTLEKVPSQQLFILPAIAFITWFVDLVSGFFLYHESRVEKSLVRWIWIASALVALLLIAAALLMV
ncbi:MAG: PH domain-containing protein [Anaerolineaceae bacterium]|nr:PH domain-containing protein [Anaerolineaceae bacterium]